MYKAIWNSDFPAIATLIKEGYDINTPGIFTAIFQKEIVPAIKLFLEQPNINASKILTEIISLSLEDDVINPEILELVLEYPATRKNIDTELGRYLIKGNNIEVINLFLEYGADPNFGIKPPIEIACYRNVTSVSALQKKIQIIKLLLTYGADLNIISKDSLYSGLTLFGIIFSKKFYRTMNTTEIYYHEYYQTLINFYEYLKPLMNNNGIYFTVKHRTVEQTINFYEEFFFQKDITPLKKYANEYFDYLTENWRLGENEIIEDTVLKNISDNISKSIGSINFQQILELNAINVYTFLVSRLTITSFSIGENEQYIKVSPNSSNVVFIKKIFTFNLCANLEDIFEQYADDYCSQIQKIYDWLNVAEHIDADELIKICQKISLQKTILLIIRTKFNDVDKVKELLDKFKKLFQDREVKFYRKIDGIEHNVVTADAELFKNVIVTAVSLYTSDPPFPVFP